MNKPTPAQLLRVFNRYELIEIILDDFAADVKSVGGNVDLNKLYFGHASARAALEGAMLRKKQAIQAATPELAADNVGDVIPFRRSAAS